MIVVTYTAEEARALADVLTPGVRARDWQHYTHRYDAYVSDIGPRGPSLISKRLGSYALTKIGTQRVLAMKSELHLATDGKTTPHGVTLPLRKLFHQIIAEARPDVFVTTGTAGGVSCAMQLGDVVVSRAARFCCQAEYQQAPFNNTMYRSTWTVPAGKRSRAEGLMRPFAAHLASSVAPPNADCSCAGAAFPARIRYDGAGGIPAFKPILTVDFFEFGTSTNGLDQLGMAVEMDDAVLGLTCSELASPPHWVSVRNLSDPAINGDLTPDAQTTCAAGIYADYGYWTSVMSGLAVWGIVAAM